MHLREFYEGAGFVSCYQEIMNYHQERIVKVHCPLPLYLDKFRCKLPLFFLLFSKNKS